MLQIIKYVLYIAERTLLILFSIFYLVRILYGYIVASPGGFLRSRGPSSCYSLTRFASSLFRSYSPAHSSSERARSNSTMTHIRVYAIRSQFMLSEFWRSQYLYYIISI